MTVQQPEQINLDPQKVINKLRDQVATLGWQNTILETRAEMAEERCAELLKALEERSGGDTA